MAFGLFSLYPHKPPKIPVSSPPFSRLKVTIKLHNSRFYHVPSCRGFGFVTFDNEEGVERAVNNQGGHTIDRKAVEVKRAVPRGDGDSSDRASSEKSTKMFIGGLLKSTTEETVKSYFEGKFNCTVESVELIYEKRDQIPPGQEPRPR